MSLDKPVHFTGLDDSDIVVPPGLYKVTPSEESRLTLTPIGETEGAGSVTIVATATEFGEPLGGSLALSIPYKEDEHHLMLLLPDGKARDAVGSYSGVRTRATTVLSYSTVKQYAISQPFYYKLAPLPQGPDLKIISVTGIPSNAPAFETVVGTYTITRAVLYRPTVTIRNVGTAEALIPGGTQILRGPGFFVNSLSDIDTVKNQYNFLIKPAETKTYTIWAMGSCPRPIGSTTPQIQLAVDPDNKVVESNELNNGLSINLVAPTISGTPDLVVTKVSFLPPQPTREQAVSLDIEMKNQGTGPALFCKNDRYWSSNGGPGPRGTGYSTHWLIMPGQIFKGGLQTFVTPLTLLPGTYPITVTVDPNNEAAESNESNNSMSATLTIAQ